MKRQQTRRRTDNGFSLIELLIVVGIILVLVAIAIPNLVRSKAAANETAAAGDLKTLETDASVYNQGEQVFPALAADMGGGEVAGTTASTCALNEEMQTQTAKNWDSTFAAEGYTFLYKAGGTTVTGGTGCSGNTLWEGTAIPTSAATGSRAFCTDLTGIYYVTPGVGATPASGSGCSTDGYPNSLN